jgi:dihydroorotase-like cyclic amidohydrolase
MDLIIRNARLADRSSAELCDICVGNGRIVAIERRLAAGGRTLGVVRLAITEMGRATVRA